MWRGSREQLTRNCWLSPVITIEPWIRRAGASDQWTNGPSRGGCTNFLGYNEVGNCQTRLPPPFGLTRKTSNPDLIGIRQAFNGNHKNLLRADLRPTRKKLGSTQFSGSLILLIENINKHSLIVAIFHLSRWFNFLLGELISQRIKVIATVKKYSFRGILCLFWVWNLNGWSTYFGYYSR